MTGLGQGRYSSGSAIFGWSVCWQSDLRVVVGSYVAMKISLLHQVLVPTSQNLYILRFHAVKMFQLQFCLLHLPPFSHKNRFVKREKDNAISVFGVCQVLARIFDQETRILLIKRHLDGLSTALNMLVRCVLQWKRWQKSSPAMEDIENTPQAFFNDAGTSWKFLYRGSVRNFY